MKTKQLLILVSIFVLSSYAEVFSQAEVTSKKEIYVYSSSLKFNSVDLKMKKQIKENTYLSFGLVDVYFDRRGNDPGTPAFPTMNMDMSGGVVVGCE